MKKSLFSLAVIIGVLFLTNSCSKDSSTGGGGSIKGKFSYELDGVKKTGTYTLPSSSLNMGVSTYSSNTDMSFANILFSENSNSTSSLSSILSIYIPISPRTGNFTINKSNSSLNNLAQYTPSDAMSTLKIYTSNSDSRSFMNVSITSYDPRTVADAAASGSSDFSNIGLVKGTFSGTLYDRNGSGQKVTITNGTFEAVNLN